MYVAKINYAFLGRPSVEINLQSQTSFEVKKAALALANGLAFDQISIDISAVVNNG